MENKEKFSLEEVFQLINLYQENYPFMEHKKQSV